MPSGDGADNNGDEANTDRSGIGSFPSRRTFVKTAGAGAVVSGLAGCQGNGDGNGSGGSISIGTIFPTTGSLAALGGAEYNGIEMRINEINDDGGIDGREIEVQNKDVASPDAAQSAVLEYSDAGVDMVMGTLASAAGRTAANVANREGLVYMETGAVSQEITAGGEKNIFRTNPSTQLYAVNVMDAIEYIVDQQFDQDVGDVTWAHAHEDSTYGTSVDEYLTQTNEENLGMEKVQTSSYPADTNNLTPIILNLQENEPDILLQTGYVNDTTLFWETAEQQDYTPPFPLGVGSGTLNESLPEAIGNDFRGIPASGVNGTNTNSDFAPVEEFKPAYEEAYGDLVNWGFANMTYTGMEITELILRETGGSTDINEFAEAAMSLDEPLGTFAAGYGVKFDETGQNTRAVYPTSQWQETDNGELETYHIYPEEGQLPDVDIKYIPRPSWSEMS